VIVENPPVEHIINLHIEKLPESVYLATSEDGYWFSLINLQLTEFLIKILKIGDL
jgi:hypothetical protein